nr:hypothetical protein JVH1_4023 [Rhodococcus sp. JVH1]
MTSDLLCPTPFLSPDVVVEFLEQVLQPPAGCFVPFDFPVPAAGAGVVDQDLFGRGRP